MATGLKLFFVVLLLLRSVDPCFADAKDDIATGAMASILVFFLRRTTEQPSMSVEVSDDTGILHDSKQNLTMECFYNETLSCLYNEATPVAQNVTKERAGKKTISFLRNETGHGNLKVVPKQSMALVCPRSCFRPDPVCGVDGKTYWCGTADAECAGVGVDHVGFCEIVGKGAGANGVLAVQSLFLVHMIWLMLAAGLLVFGVL